MNSEQWAQAKRVRDSLERQREAERDLADIEINQESGEFSARVAGMTVSGTLAYNNRRYEPESPDTCERSGWTFDEVEIESIHLSFGPGFASVAIPGNHPVMLAVVELAREKFDTEAAPPQKETEE